MGCTLVHECVPLEHLPIWSKLQPSEFSATRYIVILDHFNPLHSNTWTWWHGHLMKFLFWNSNHCTCCCQTKESKEGPFLEVQARCWQKKVGMEHHAANCESLSTWRPFIVAIFFLQSPKSRFQIPNETSTPNMNHIFTKAKTGKGAQTAKHRSQHRKWELVYFEHNDPCKAIEQAVINAEAQKLWLHV